MAKTSWNLSERFFFTKNHNDGTAYIGYLDSTQEKVVTLTPEELDNLQKAIAPGPFKLTDDENEYLRWALAYTETYHPDLFKVGNVLTAKLKEFAEYAPNKLKTIFLMFSNEIEDDTIDEIESTMEFWILDDYYEINYENGVFKPRYFCEWCDGDITKAEADKQVNESKILCKECLEESKEDSN
jgi:predicted DNA-binding antitoxin AbrB/MazE fold protein